MKTKKSIYSVSVLVVLAMLTLSGCGAVGQLISQSVLPVAAESHQESATAPVLSAPDTGAMTQGTVLDALEATLGGIYENVNPSVVSIQVTQKVSTMMQQMPFFGGSTPQVPEEQYQQGAGSGFVWDKQGHIVTNNHVVADADKIRVQFSDGTIAVAEIVGTDADSDLAVIKVNVPAERLHPVTMADSAQVRVGQLAVAIGNPFGLENTMTVGFISAVGRSMPVDLEGTTGASYTIPDIIQTDAPINPGNSGGVLVNEEGKVVGVPSAIISPVQASAGIGFAIPAAIVEKVVPALIDAGNYTHAWLGISGTTLIPDVAQAMNLDENQRGALVITVQDGSPASKAGLRGSDGQITVDGQNLPTGGDVIIALGGNPVNTFDDLVANLARFSAGETTTLTVIRDGKTRELTITLGERPKQSSTAIVPTTPQQDEASPSTPQTAWLGIMAMTLDSQIATAMDLPADQQGVLVGQVQSASPADKAGLRGSNKVVTLNGQEFAVGGDVIIAWNGEAITSMPQLQMRVRQSQPGDEVTLTILRNGKRQQLVVTLEARP
ncbi:MAG TPA: trypsin-like peptidase domain-containing protein [Anaerolineae bacterium]|nr:trypsin-like peptidase domain-containing protein [Anaerolineae bacterium]HQI83264.1 trypsin-like peptidase domain-containing protein [Anaerolineae bacterium]